MKITIDSIKNVNWYDMYDGVVNERFKRGHNFEITHVRKGENYNFV
jgi:hypothetical protein